MGLADLARTAEEHLTTASGQDYGAVLDRYQLARFERGPWLVVGHSPLAQGWKLHISCTLVDAVALLETVIPLLVRESISFKIAKNSITLGLINEGELGRTQVGKFITIYPKSTAQAREIAQILVEVTRRFEGPAVPTDLKLSESVYARYGGHNPIITRDRLGQLTSSIYAHDGRLCPDRYTVPFQLPEGLTNPFDGMLQIRPRTPVITDENGQPITPKSTKLFGPGYLVLELIKAHAKGGVFRGIDLRARETVSVKIIKQGLRHCLCDEYGRDMRSRLRRQQVLHQLLHTRAPVPNADAYFEVDGDGYLPLEYIEGRSIETFVLESLEHRSWASIPVASQRNILLCLNKLLRATSLLHVAGYVHRDLTASNIWIGSDGEIYLLDLELAHALNDSAPPIGLGTAGFMSPQQERRERVSLSDDIYSLGCLFILALTGMDPRRILFGNEERRFAQLMEFTGGAAPALLRVISRAVLSDPSERPSVAEIQIALSEAVLGRIRPTRARPVGYANVIQQGLAGMIGAVPRDSQLGVWLSPTLHNAMHRGISRNTSAIELRRSANRGVAGVIYLLSRAARLGYETAELKNSVQLGVDWLLCSSHPTPDMGLPGLHFGEAGVAVAVSEAIAASLVVRTKRILAFIEHALSGTLDWPDITHGAAGQGIAAFCCADLLGDETIAEHAHSCANYLVSTQQPDGSWVMPPGVDGMSGQTLTGFAHGVAGIVYFLVEYDARFQSSAAQRAWRAGIEWLEHCAIPSKSRLEWDYSDTLPKRWQWWCHGGPGIALTFLRLYEQTSEKHYAAIARKALRLHPTHLRYPNLTQCHGLSGLGDIYLEAARVLGDRIWIERASDINQVLLTLSRAPAAGMLTWLAEDPYFPSADLMIGAGGVIHFLMRFHNRRCAPSFVLLPEPSIRGSPASGCA